MLSLHCAGSGSTMHAGFAQSPSWRFEPRACAALLAMHATALAGFWTGVSKVALAVAALLFLVRAVAVAAGFHRFFSHRAFRAARPVEIALAVAGTSAAQMGPLWWAAHHRRHHRESDRPGDVHSPIAGGLFWAHMGWLLSDQHTRTAIEEVPDLAHDPLLRWLDRWHFVPTLALGAGCFALGAVLARTAPELGTSGAQMLVVGFLWSTLALSHTTFAVNSLGHRFGTRRYETGDHSRNNPFLALISLGEGWQNNHHRFPGAARAGVFPWEFDPIWWMLRALAALGLVWELRPVPAEAYAARPRALRKTSTTTTIAAQPSPNASPTRP
jgi:stearoyl-CoA desaturase (delta-9 desaturase)